MPFPTGTDFDRHEPAIQWLRAALGTDRYPLLRRRALPKLEAALEANFAPWIARWEGYLIPSLVLAVTRWRHHGHAPHALLGRLEKGLEFNQANAAELGNLTGNIWDPQLSSTTIMQLMVTASLLESVPRALLDPVTADRPDLWATIDGRRVGIEITCRNHLEDLRQAEGGTIDWKLAAEDFAALWRRPISRKLDDYTGDFPIVLVVWDCHILGDVYNFVNEEDPGGTLRSFCDLLHLHEPDCSPLSAIVYLPYVKAPHVVLCDGLTRGMCLTTNEAAGLRKLFEVNPALENGFLPPEELT